jgi:hypothetical protein
LVHHQHSFFIYKITIMKRLFCIAALVLVFTSCKKNTDDIKRQSNPSAAGDQPVTNDITPTPTPAYDWAAMPTPLVDPPYDPDGLNTVMPANGLVYCLKGFSYSKTLYKLNNTTKRWALSSDFGFDPLSQYFFSYQSKLYFGMPIVGGNVLSSFHSVDVSTGATQYLAPFPGTPVASALCFVVGDKGYILSGVTPDLTIINQCWEYNFSTNQWTNKGNNPLGARGGASVFVIDNKVYMGLGYEHLNLNGQKITLYKNDWILYSPSSSLSAVRASFPGQKRSAAHGFAINSAAYLGFGANSNGFLNDFWKYNPSSNTWTQQASWPGTFTERNDFGGFSLGNTGYIVKGELAEFWRFSNSPFNP